MALGKMQSATQTKNMIITKEKRFKVIILKGKVTALRTGRMKELSKPMVIPTSRMVARLPSEVMPLMKYKDKAVPTIPESILDKTLRIG
jgi:hypothetical protein